MTKRFLTALLLAAAATLVGCGPPGRTKEETIEVKEDSPLNEAKKLLESYAKGQPLGSETTSYQYLVTGVRKTDAPRADVLEKGFADLQKTSKAGVPAKAKDVLAKLAPKMTAE
jgi:hypothetical protein